MQDQAKDNREENKQHRREGETNLAQRSLTEEGKGCGIAARSLIAQQGEGHAPVECVGAQGDDE